MNNETFYNWELLMTYVGSVLAFFWYLLGLALLFTHEHIIWGIVGIFLPIIPYVYTIMVVVDKYFK